MPAGPVVGEATPVCAQRRSTAGHGPARLGLTDTWGKGPARSWASSEQTNGLAVAEGNLQDEASQQHRPEVDESPAPKVGEEVQVWRSAEAHGHSWHSECPASCVLVTNRMYHYSCDVKEKARR